MSSPGNDSALSEDTCMFLEAARGDGGQNKGSNPNWWNSWDFSVTDPDNQDQDVTGQPLKDGHKYTVHVRLHMALESCPSPDADFVQAEVYLCFPFAATNPTNPKTLLLKRFAVDPAQFQSDPAITNGKVYTVRVDHVFQLDGENDDGHRCLVARCFQHGIISSTSPTDFFVPDDQHYGQHNLNITRVPQGQSVRNVIATRNGNREEMVTVTLRIDADLQPQGPLLELLLPRLQQIEGFQRVATTVYPRGFSLRLPDFPDAEIRDHSTSEHPFYAVTINMQPEQEALLFFEVDTSDDEPGIARLYHVTHNEGERVVGGVTMVTLAARSE